MANKNNFFRTMVKELGDVDTHIAEDAMNSSEFSGTIDTGSYILNAALSGSIFGGVPNNKIIAFAGESATGKTFFVLGMMKQFLDDNEDGGVIYYDTEAAVTKEMMVDRGIDTSRVIISEIATVEGFRTHVSRTLDRYMEAAAGDRPPMMMVLDSLGQLSTNKETGDINEGKDARDMTRAQLIRGTFRALSLKLARANVPLIVTNHVADQIGAYVPTKVMGGGAGLRYAASQIVFLSKKKDRNGTEVVGNIIHCKMDKSRFTKENKMVDVRLSYDRGLDRYYGLLDLAEKYGIIKKTGTRFEMPDGSKVFGTKIEADPEKYFTKEVLTQLDEAAGKEFKYGRGEPANEVSEESEEHAEV
jgi:RecA/RadA recombinase